MNYRSINDSNEDVPMVRRIPLEKEVPLSSIEEALKLILPTRGLAVTLVIEGVVNAAYPVPVAECGLAEYRTRLLAYLCSFAALMFFSSWYESANKNWIRLTTRRFYIALTVNVLAALVYLNIVCSSSVDCFFSRMGYNTNDVMIISSRRSIISIFLGVILCYIRQWNPAAFKVTFEDWAARFNDEKTPQNSYIIPFKPTAVSHPRDGDAFQPDV